MNISNRSIHGRFRNTCPATEPIFAALSAGRIERSPVDTICRIMLVFRQQETLERIKSILVENGHRVLYSCTSGMQALRLAGLHDIDIAVVGFTLSDMSGIHFAADLLAQHTCSVLLIVPAEQMAYARQSIRAEDIVCLPRPITPQALLTSIELMMQYRDRLSCMRAETQKLKEDLKRRSLADKAKTILMNALQLTEFEAWRFMQKTSMDTGTPLLEVAEKIIEQYGRNRQDKGLSHGTPSSFPDGQV